MQKRLVQAASVAMLLATMAAPAYARGNGDEGGSGRGPGLFASLKHDLKIGLAHDNGLHLGWSKNGKHDEDDDDDVMSACLRTAQEAHDAAVRTARTAAKTAKDAARTAYHQAVKTAQKAYKDAKKSAIISFRASVKDDATLSAYAAARVKAEADWSKAMKTAQDTWSAAKAAADTTWNAAKAKADADFKAAKDACTSAASAPPTDTVAPAAVTNLALSAATTSSVLLTWTAPGDDNATGTAASYDVRYSTSAIVTAADFAAAAQATGEPTPLVAGSVQTMTVSGLTTGTTYYFAIKSQDEVPNVSVMSNVMSLATL